MLTGNAFLLRADTLGLEAHGAKQEAVLIPANEVVIVASGPRSDDQRLVDVQWKGRTIALFAEDIECRGAQVLRRSA